VIGSAGRSAGEAIVTEVITSLAAERLIRRAPDHPLRLGDEDQAYLLACLGEIERGFGITAVPDLPLTVLPGRTLMRRLVVLRQTLRPQNAEQRATLGRLAGAILLLDTACALDHDLKRG
jgi:hypothetical protein